MMVVVLLVTLATLALGAFGERYLRERANRQSDKLKALSERLDVYVNYNKLAAVRKLEADETLADLRQQVAEAEAELKRLQAGIDAAEGQAPMEFYCFDRVPRADGALWYIAVEALDRTVPWTGVKHYALVAESADEARKRIQERHPAPASFAIGPATPLSLPTRP